MQPVDYTTLIAVCSQLQADWLPARIEQVYQRDTFTISLALRTLNKRGWLTLAWHPQGARICLDDPPPRTPDTFTFSDQLRHQLKGFALTQIAIIKPWERVVDLQFSKRPGEIPTWHLYLEVMSKYSNVILATAKGQIITVAHQVNQNQSSLRPLQTGQKYELPPPLTADAPNLSESKESWQKRVGLIPEEISRQLIKVYRGLSPNLVQSLLQKAEVNPKQSTADLSPVQWERLFQAWQEWLTILETKSFTPGWQRGGYTVLGWNMVKPEPDIHDLLNSYYTEQLNRQSFQQKKQQLQQKLTGILGKLKTKGENFARKILEAEGADEYRYLADLLMANLHKWQPGMKEITLADFTTQAPVKITLNPEKNAVQNAQTLYKKHQKLKRATDAVTPLWQETMAEIEYLEQVLVTVSQLETYQTKADLVAIEGIREELIEQKYLKSNQASNPNQESEFEPLRYTTPSGFQLWIGRNNRQNEQLTFRVAGDYDLWFHTQEIPGSHALLRLEPGSVASESDLQFTADLTAYYSKARESDQAPVVYTKPKHVYKPKGAQPGMAIYKKEQVIWGSPQRAKQFVENEE